MQNFYVDTCIYLNLWQKEKGIIFGKPFWLIAKEFFEYAENQDSVIFRILYRKRLNKTFYIFLTMLLITEKCKLYFQRVL